MRRSKIDRRACLKGLGVSLALPLMDSLGWADTPKGKEYKPPVRLGFMYMPHGVIMDQFWPTHSESYLSSPPPALESLRPVLHQCVVMKGISGVPIDPFNGAPHALELSTWLTAILPAAEKRNEINIAISADQIAANHLGAFTALPSLELATEIGQYPFVAGLRGPPSVARAEATVARRSVLQRHYPPPVISNARRLLP